MLLSPSRLHAPKHAAIFRRSADLPVETTLRAPCPVGPLASLDSGAASTYSARAHFCLSWVRCATFTNTCYFVTPLVDAEMDRSHTSLTGETQDEGLGRVRERWKEGGRGNEGELFSDASGPGTILKGERISPLPRLAFRTRSSPLVATAFCFLPAPTPLRLL